MEAALKAASSQHRNTATQLNNELNAYIAQREELNQMLQPGSRLDTVRAQDGDQASPAALYNQPTQRVQNKQPLHNKRPSVPLTGYNSAAALGTDAMLRQAAENLEGAQQGESGSADDGTVRSKGDNIKYSAKKFDREVKAQNKTKEKISPEH